MICLDKTDKQDVWRLGGLMFHLVTGKAPYQAYDSLGILSHKSTSTQQKKASFLKDIFTEKEIEICILEISADLNIKSKEAKDSVSGQGISNTYPTSQLNRIVSTISFAKEHYKKVECLVRLFMEKNIHKRLTIKEFKENQSLKSLLAKYKSSRSSVEINENSNKKLLSSVPLRCSSESPLESLKRQDPCEVLRKIVSPGFSAWSSENREFEALPLEAKLQILFEENLNLKKDNEKYKLDNSRLESENKNFQNEIDSLRTNNDKDRKSIEEEKKRMNTLNQDRISKINELDEMTNEIIELKSKLRLLENENDMVKFDLKEGNETVVELQQQIDKFQADFEREKYDYQIKIENLNKNIKKFEKYFLDDHNETSSFFKDDESMKRFVVLFYDLVKDFKENLDRFIISNFTDKAEILYSINQMLSEKEDMIKNYYHKVKNDFMDDYLRISTISASRPDKTKERFEWMKKQVVELTPFKNKSLNLEIENNKLNYEKKITAENIVLKDTEIELLKKLNQGLKENIKANINYISQLESNLGYIKDFMFQRFPQCIEELKI